MKKPAFPKVIKEGHTKAIIYRYANRDSISYTVAWYEGEVRKRKVFADLEEAKLHAQARVGQLSKGTAEILRLEGAELLAYVRAREAVAEFGLALDTIAFEYRDAKRLIRGGSLVEACRYYARQRLLDIPKKTVDEVYTEMIAAKKAEGCSERYIEDLESRVTKFVQAFPARMISGVTGAEIKDWLQGLQHATSRTDPRAPKRAGDQPDAEQLPTVHPDAVFVRQVAAVFAGGLERDGVGPALEDEGWGDRDLHAG